MSRQRNSQPNNSPFAPLAIGFFIGLITVGTIVLVWNYNRESHSSPVSRAPATAPPPAAPSAFTSSGFSNLGLVASSGIDPAVVRVASRFDCACGSCSDTLDECHCETAHAERAFIQTQLSGGHTEAEAADAVQAKYGGLRS